MVMIWSPLMIDKLLNHLEEHKGRTGLYYVCAQEAFKSACKFLKEHYPSLTVTNLQIRNKLGNILSNGIDVSHACTEENGYKELYVHGRNILKQRYSSRSLQKEQAKTDSRKTRQQSSRDWDSSWRSSLLESQAGQTCISTPPFSKPTGDSSALTRSVANRDRSLSTYEQSQSSTSNDGYLEGREDIQDRSNYSDSDNDDAKISSSDLIDYAKGLSSPRNVNTRETSVADDVSENVHSAGDGRNEWQILEEHFKVDSQHFIASRYDLESLGKQTHESVKLCVQQLQELGWESRGKASYNPTFEGHANPYSVLILEETPFLEVCEKIFDTKDHDKLLDRAGLSVVPVRDFMQALFAAAVFTWILECSPPCLSYLRDPDSMKIADEELDVKGQSLLQLRKLHPSLYKRLILKTRSDMSRRPDLFKGRSRSFATAFFSATKNFLTFHKLMPTTPEGRETLLHSFEEIFTTALRWKALMNLDENVRPIWPRVGDAYEQNQMKVSGSGQAEASWKVHMVLFPALLRKVQDKKRERGFRKDYVWKASVLLQ